MPISDSMPKTRPDTVAGFSVSTPTPCRQICRLLPHLHAHFHANHLFLYHKLSNNILSIDFWSTRILFAPYARTRLLFDYITRFLFTITPFLFTFRIYNCCRDNSPSFLRPPSFSGYLSIFSCLFVTFDPPLWSPLTQLYTLSLER